jgi:hypothetical protein
MWRITFMILFVACAMASITQADIWLTNGITPGSIDFIGDVTGDNITDICESSLCHINIQNNAMPKFQQYMTCMNGTLSFSPYRHFNSLYLGHSTNYGLFTRFGDCRFNLDRFFIPLSQDVKTCHIRGNDINGDNIYDYVVTNYGLANVAIGMTNFFGTPLPPVLFTSGLARDHNNFLIVLSDTDGIYIADIDNDTENEVILNNANKTDSVIYDLITITNWSFAGSNEYVQCLGDWNNDGYEDIVFYNGRVHLGIPEANSLLLLVLVVAGVLQRKDATHNPQFDNPYPEYYNKSCSSC